MKNLVAPFAMCFKIGCLAWRVIAQRPVLNIPLHISLISESFDRLDILTSLKVEMIYLVIWAFPTDIYRCRIIKRGKTGQREMLEWQFFYIAPSSNEWNT